MNRVAASLVLALLFGLLLTPNLSADDPPVGDRRSSEEKAAKRILDACATNGALPEGVTVRVSAHLFRSDGTNEKLEAEAKKRGVPFQKELKETWDFTAKEVTSLNWEKLKGDEENGIKEEWGYRRVGSVPLVDAKLFVKALTEGKVLEIHARKGTGDPIHYYGTDFEMGGRSVEIYRDGKEILSLHEHCTGAGYAETDARAFAALYESLAKQGRAAFRAKEEPAK